MHVLQDLEFSFQGSGCGLGLFKFGGAAVGKAHAVLIEQVFNWACDVGL